MTEYLLKGWFLAGLTFSMALAVYSLYLSSRYNLKAAYRAPLSLLVIVMILYEFWREIHLPLTLDTIPKSVTRYYMIRLEDSLFVLFWVLFAIYDVPKIYEKLQHMWKRLVS